MEAEADERPQQFVSALRTTQKSTVARRVAWRMENRPKGQRKVALKKGDYQKNTRNRRLRAVGRNNATPLKKGSVKK